MFILTALNEAKVEVRIQFKDVTQGIFKDISRNELVIRIQPSEAVYLKLNTKTPGLNTRAIPTEMDLTYKRRFTEAKIPEAYEALILDALRGDHSNFVRDDELDVAWRVRPFSVSVCCALALTAGCSRCAVDLHAHPALDRGQERARAQARAVPVRLARPQRARLVHRQVRVQAHGPRVVSIYFPSPFHLRLSRTTVAVISRSMSGSGYMDGC